MINRQTQVRIRKAINICSYNLRIYTHLHTGELPKKYASSLQPFNYKDAKMNFVYLLILDNEVVYIGSTQHIYQRVVSHIKSKPFTSFMFIRLASKAKALRFEKEMIKALSPKHNKNK